MNLQDVWQAVKRNEAERYELNSKFYGVEGIYGCWQGHYERTAFSLWGYWEGEEYCEHIQLCNENGVDVWRKVDRSGESGQLAPLSDKDARLLMKIWEKFV